VSDSARFFCFRDERYYSALPPGRMALNDPDGLLAAGGNLDTATLMHAYRHGIFPWYSAGQPLLWWAPDPRTVFFFFFAPVSHLALAGPHVPATAV